MKQRTTLRLALLLVTAAFSIAAAVLIGSVTLDWQGVIEGDMSRTILLDLRLPRALGAFACGGLLALAGALMQVLLRNPLADPYVLGVSGGAAVGALLAMLLGGAALVVGGAAFSGAFAAMLLVFALAHGEGSWTQTRLLLTGVIVASGSGAVVALILATAPDQALRGMLFWLMGDAGQISDPWPALALLALGLAIAIPFARDLNALARGEVLAQALGVRVGRLRGLVYFLAALLTAGAVTTAGSIGFVGLVVPHLARMLIGNDQRLLLPTAVLAGGTLLTLADTLARTIIAPQQLPVGVLTALLGVPLFLFLLSRQPKTP
jgi:iron complex transport system permease protein